MKIAFAGLRHGHIFRLAEVARSTPGVEITGAWEENEQAAQEAREKFTEPFYDSFEALLADPQVELVYIATPHSHHFAHMMLCMAAGKPVICEKSFTMNAEQARQAATYVFAK